METLIFHAKVYLSRGKFAEAVLVRDGRIAAVGTEADAACAAGRGAERIDAGGRLLLPGFYDCHQHLIMAGRQARKVDANAASIDELIARGRETIERIGIPKGAFVTGLGWDDAVLGRCPTREDLDRISTEHAVVLSRRCGHAMCCNTLALRRAGIDPEGHSGMLWEGEGAPVSKAIPPETERQKLGDLLAAVRSAHKFGITAIATNDVRGDVDVHVRIFDELFRDPKLRLRITEQCSIENEAQLDGYIAAGYRTGTWLIPDFLKFGPLKLFADGSLGARTAFMRAPYRDAPDTRGVRVIEPDALRRYVEKADANGLQVAVHAIGDGAIDDVLSAYEHVIDAKNQPADAHESINSLRHGIVHCQITDSGLLSRFAKSDVLALVQPIFLQSDRRVLTSRVGGELASTSYAWAAMERLNIRTAYGTDCPIETANPLENIAAAVTRYGESQNERVDVATAVDACTAGSAYANFDEARLGRISPGMCADFALLERDIFSIPPQEIAETRVCLTIVNGEVVYEMR
ncbi:MAG: amidohydrolase [Clostridiales bacterium]|jgi:predicted amidohydrolase YtcJ|nr:amidohydrolase [Clostridiales bacterium]